MLLKGRRFSWHNLLYRSCRFERQRFLGPVRFTNQAGDRGVRGWQSLFFLFFQNRKRYNLVYSRPIAFIMKNSASHSFMSQKQVTWLCSQKKCCNRGRGGSNWNERYRRFEYSLTTVIWVRGGEGRIYLFIRSTFGPFTRYSDRHFFDQTDKRAQSAPDWIWTTPCGRAATGSLPPKICFPNQFRLWCMYFPSGPSNI